MTTEPEAIPADVLEDAKSLGALVRDWMTGPAPLAGGKLEQVIALRLQRLATRASRAPVDGAEAKPVAWVIPRDDNANMSGFIDAMAYRDGEFTMPLFTHPAPASPDAELVRDEERLDALREESWDLRCFDIPTGQGDADIGWRVIGHYMAEPKERVIGEVYHDDPRAAIDAALLSKHGGDRS